MKPKLIVMLTHNDQTIYNADEIFNECKDLPIECWGFKNVGISTEDMCKLLNDMKKAGKKTFLEVVTYTEDSCMKGAEFACRHNFDYLLGTVFYSSVWEYIKTKPIEYFPFVGNVTGSPSVLNGSIEDILNQALEFQNKNIPGIDLLAFRHEQQSPTRLSKDIVSNLNIKTIVAGSINSFERIEFIKELNPWGFTIGSALVTGNFVHGKSFRTNLEKVINIF